MNGKDIASIVILVILLILLVFISGFLIIISSSSERNEYPSSLKNVGTTYCYKDGKIIDCDEDIKPEFDDFDTINYERRDKNDDGSSYRNGGSGGTGPHCSDNQIIMRLFGEENTHGALWNESIYPVKVCYNEIFGSYFDNKGMDPHQCSGSQGNEENIVLRLIQSFNSHAEAPDAFSGNYNLPVCYGDLQCVSRNTECIGDEKEIVSLASLNNGHLESRNSNNYEFRICCSSSGSF